jgi:hypothetical protein
MASTWQPPSTGPIDDVIWPERLTGAAIERASNDDRVHGYAVLGDVARHYAFSDLVFLAIVGELPSDRASRLFQLALAIWSPVSIAEAPTHAAVLSRICGGSFSAAAGCGLATLAERARFLVESFEPLYTWLAHPDAALPEIARDPDGRDRAWLDLMKAVGTDLDLVRGGMSRPAAALALLYEAGIRTSEQAQAAIVLAGSCGVVAEALRASPSDLPGYPLTLPPFHYVEGP